MSTVLALSASTIKTLTMRDFLSALKGLGPYVAATISFLVSSFLVKNHMGNIPENDILVSADPLIFPLMVSLVVVAIYLAMISSISISRDKDQGTLEVLFYGPVSPASYLLAKFVADIMIYLFVAALLIVYFTATSVLTNLAFSLSLIKAIFISLFSASCVISFSIFVSSFTAKTRTSIIWLVALLLSFLALEVANDVMLQLPEQSLTSSMVYLRNALSFVAGITKWVSPFSIFEKGIESISTNNSLNYSITILYAMLYSFILIILSIYNLNRKGVRA